MCPGRRRSFWRSLPRVDEAVHMDRACGEKVIAIDVAVACQPIGTVIVDAGAGELEERNAVPSSSSLLIVFSLSSMPSTL
jgi:hypothetical protein